MLTAQTPGPQVATGRKTSLQSLQGMHPCISSPAPSSLPAVVPPTPQPGDQAGFFPASSPGWSEQGTSVALPGNRSARAFKEVALFTRATIHLSSSFDKHAFMLHTASCSCKSQPCSLGQLCLSKELRMLPSLR